MSLPWTGIYINLDRARDRRALMETQLAGARLSAHYARYPAVDGRSRAAKPGGPLAAAEVGCFRSHADVIAVATPGRWLHVLEDDVMLPAEFPGMVQSLLGAGSLQPFDLVFTDVIISAAPIVALRGLVATYNRSMAKPPSIVLGVIDLRDSNFGGANSYFVNPASLPKVRSVIAAELDRGPTLGIDMLYRREVQSGGLRAACIFPFISRVHLELATASTIGTREFTDAQSMASDLLRLAFYVEHDPREIAAALARLKPRSTADARMDMLSDVFRVLVADDAG